MIPNPCRPVRPGPRYAASDFCAPGQLTPEIQACLETPSSDCDRLFYGLCQSDQYKQTTICACINNVQPSCAYQTSKMCSRLADGFQAYVPTTQTRNCAHDTICNNLIIVNGNSDDLTTVAQSCNNTKPDSGNGGGNDNSGGGGAPPTPAGNPGPLIATVAIGFIILIAFLWIVLGRRNDAAVAAQLSQVGFGNTVAAEPST